MLNKIQLAFNKILVTGNGFDLNLGLKTSYQDFVNSSFFKKLCDDKNELAIFIQKINKKNNWANIESQLKIYANQEDKLNKIDKEKLFNEFIVLKNALTTYLRDEECRFLNLIDTGDSLSKTIAFDLVRNAHKESSYPTFGKIISFNYTDVLLNYCYPGTYLYIHGSLVDNNIVFGVEDGGVDPKFAFLNKSDHHAYGPVNLRDEVENAEEIHFFGCALGETDDTQFKPVFEYLTSRDSRSGFKKRKKIVFYVFGKEGYYSLRNNLLRHTKNRVGELKVNNQVIFYDVSGENLKEIDQAWLNSFQDYP
ncbi:MAG: hypothetical protein RL344_1336 [Pseudomonadota bacterium]